MKTPCPRGPPDYSAAKKEHFHLTTGGEGDLFYSRGKVLCYPIIGQGKVQVGGGEGRRKDAISQPSTLVWVPFQGEQGQISHLR